MSVLPRVLVLGIYLADRLNTAQALVHAYGSATEWDVTQRWIALGQQTDASRLEDVTVAVLDRRLPKFTLLNQELSKACVDDFEFILVSDDDIELPPSFLDSYLRLVERHDFALAQPARAHGSYVDHPFVEQLDGIRARRTNYVEIGPLLSMRQDAARLMLPFDTSSPMGWGYDFVWPRLLGAAGLKLGIVDATPVEHAIRKPVEEYAWDEADRQRRDYLAARPHARSEEAFVIVESYA
jgi:hypothetical protein